MRVRTDRPVTVDEAREIAALCKEIGKLTGRRVVSQNLGYLRARASDLRKRKDTGSLPNQRSSDPSSVVSVSLTASRVALLAEICERKKEKASAIIRAAFDQWAARNGFSVEIAHIKRLERAGVSS